MPKKIIIEEVFKTNDEAIKKKTIRQKLIKMIKSIQEKERGVQPREI